MEAIQLTSTSTTFATRAVQRRVTLPEPWSRGRELNPRPTDYESVALPLSYPGVPSGVYHSRSTPIIR